MSSETSTKKAAGKADEKAAAGKAPVTDIDRYLATFGTDDKSQKAAQEFLAMSPEDQAEEVEFWLLLQKGRTATDIATQELGTEREDLKIYSLGQGPLKGSVERPLQVEGYLAGTVHVHSKDFKENWEEVVRPSDGQVFYCNTYYQIVLMNGKKLNIWSSPTLRKLEKVLTHTSAPKYVKKDPYISFTYVGKIEGKERILREFNIKLTKGDSCHVCKDLVIEDGAKVMEFQKGTFNSLNSPALPGGAKAAVDVDALNVEMYERLSGNSANMAIGLDSVIDAEATPIQQ